MHAQRQTMNALNKIKRDFWAPGRTWCFNGHSFIAMYTHYYLVE